MRKAFAADPRRTRALPALIAAASLLAIAACSASPAPRPASDPADPSGSPTASPPDTAEPSSPPPAPAAEAAPAPEKPPVQTAPPPTAPAPPAPSTGEPDPAPTAVEAVTRADDPAPAEAASPPAPAPASPATVSLSGRVVLDVSGVDDVDDDAASNTIVYFKPAGASLAVTPQTYEITTRRKRLIPNVLVVPVGSTVDFPNRDDILHNVFSVSPAANFDLGLYGEGQSKSHTFREPGLAVIHCNVHHAMRADVLVVDTPFFARADADGGFDIDGITAADGELVAWHPRAGFVRRSIRLPLTAPIEIELALTRPRIPDHLDKTGQPYRPERPSRR